MSEHLPDDSLTMSEHFLMFSLTMSEHLPNVSLTMSEHFSDVSAVCCFLFQTVFDLNIGLPEHPKHQPKRTIKPVLKNDLFLSSKGLPTCKIM